MASSKPQASQTSTSKSYKAHTHHHHSPPIPHNQRVNNQSDPELEARCKANIVSLHLSAEEQLAESEGFKGVDWLKEEGTWPPAAQQRVHRYMHHHDLYQVTNINDPIFVDLVNLVKSEAGVPNTRNWEHKVPAKCTDLINMSTRAWKGDGLLVTHNNVIMKSPPFQYLWDCAVQAAQVSSSTGLSAEQNLPFSGPENEARSIDCSSVNRAAEALEGSYAHKRNAESTPQSWVARTAKRARRAKYDDDDGNSITVDVNNDWGSDQETQLDDSRERHPAAASAAGTSAGVPHKGHNTTSYTCYGNSQRDVAPTIQAARDALSALYPTEDTSAQGTTAQREDTGLAHNGNPANFVVGSNRTPVSSLSGQDDYRTQNLSYGHSNDGRESSAQSCSALTNENHPRAACPMPPHVSPPSMSQCDNSSSAISPGPQRSWNTAPLDRSLNPEGSERPAASSQASQEHEQGSKISLPGMQTIGLLTDDTSQIFQTDRREHPLNLKRTPEGTQAVSIPNHKSITADKVQSIQPPPPPHLQYQSEPPSTLHLQNQNQNQPPPRPPPPPSTQYKPQPPHSQYQHISPYQNQPPPSSQPQNQNCRPPPPPQGIPQQVGETGPSNAIQAGHMQLANGIEPNNLIAQHFGNMPGGANASAQARSLAGYQANLSQQQAAQMPNIKQPTPNTGGPQNQGSTVMGGGQNGGVVANYYNPGELGPSPQYQLPPPHPQYQSQPPASSQPQNQNQQPPRPPPPPLAQYQPPPTHPQYQNQPPPSSQPPDQSQRLPLDLSHSSPPPVKALSQVPSPPASSCQPVSPKTALPESNSPASDQPRFENRSQWKRFLETIQIVIPRYAQPGTNLHHAAARIYAAPISFIDQGVTDFFQWFSSIVETGKDSVLKFDFVDGFKQLRLTIWVPCGDPLTFESARIAAWNLFQQADLDPGLANLKVVITAHLEIPRGVNTNVHMQPHCLDPITTTSGARHDYRPAMPLQNSDNVKTAPDAAASLAKPQLRSAPSDPPSRLSPPNSRPSMCDPALKTTIGEPSYANSSKAGKESPMAFALPRQEVQLQPSQQQSRLQNQSSQQTTSTTNPTTEIVIRLQVDGYGRFSRSYGKSVLNTKIANGRFFDWFALETGHKDPQKLRFDFKDALPPKSCVIERDQDDYFELMVHDIRRKFKHARERTPDMKEFAILVTDPTWHSDSEEEDDDM